MRIDGVDYSDVCKQMSESEFIDKMSIHFPNMPADMRNEYLSEVYKLLTVGS